MADNTQIRLPAGAGNELGQSGTYFYYGYISGEEYNNNLRGKLALQNYDIMRKSDGTTRAVLEVCKLPILAAEWDIEPASDEPEDMEKADFARRELFDRKIMFIDFLREALTCLDFGHSVHEKVYEATDFNGKMRIGLSKIAYRKQRSIMSWATKENQPGITQILPAGGLVSIPRSKLAVFTNEREGENYEGISLLRYAYKHWKIKDSLELMQAIALERMALGIPIIKKGEGGHTNDEPEIEKLRNNLRQIRVNEESYLELPAGITVEMLDMKAGSTKDILPTLQYEDRQILLSVLAQFLGLGTSDGSGARALSQDHSRLFVRSLEAVARTIQFTMQQDVVNNLIDLNYSENKNGYPKIVFSNLSDDNIAELSDGVNKLMSAGALTADPDMENRLRRALRIPDLPDEMYKNYGGKQDDPESSKKKNDKPLNDVEDDLPNGDDNDPNDPKNKTKMAVEEAQAARTKLVAQIMGV